MYVKLRKCAKCGERKPIDAAFSLGRTIPDGGTRRRRRITCRACERLLYNQGPRGRIEPEIVIGFVRHFEEAK